MGSMFNVKELRAEIDRCVEESGTDRMRVIVVVDGKYRVLTNATVATFRDPGEVNHTVFVELEDD